MSEHSTPREPAGRDADPTREEHPLPAVLMHWAHLISFFVLVATGILIHRPSAAVAMDAVRTAHFIAMFVFMATFIVRVYWAFLGRGSANTGSRVRVPDWRHFAPERSNSGTLWPTVKYYVFIRKTRPFTAKYNPLQKATYALFIPLGVVVMALTGFTLYGPTVEYMLWFSTLVGGFESVRSIHYFTMWLMIAFVMIHLYLVVFEDLREGTLMLFGIAPSAGEAEDAHEVG
jgi:Ni/Fe-hydrogenase 1 B-type cytochrome subunit